MDVLSEEIVVEEPSTKTRFINVLRIFMYYGIRLGISYCIADGFWYLTVAANGLARYSLIADTGRNLIFMGLFLYLFITGDPDV